MSGKHRTDVAVNCTWACKAMPLVIKFAASKALIAPTKAIPLFTPPPAAATAAAGPHR